MPRPRTFMNEEIVQKMESHPRPFVTATELAEEFDVTNSQMGTRLRELEEDGQIESKSVGARAKVYWLAGRVWRPATA